MRKFLLAAVAVSAIASPAVARDGAGYVGIEGGILFPRDNDGDAFVDYTTTQTPTTPAAPAGPADTTFDDAFGLEYKRGYDLDLIGGYDFGMFRLEAELGYKRARIDEFELDSGDLAALNAALNRPSASPDPGAPGLPAVTAANVDFDGRANVLSAMVNALLDFGGDDGFGAYVGGGFGRARVEIIDDSDATWAYQLIAGVRTAISSQFDVGLKYRYFRTGKVSLEDEAVTLAGNPNRVVVGTTNVDQTTSAVFAADFEDRFSSHSLLASLIYNFAPPPPPPPPPAPPPPPPPPPPPATQTCPDGSVILATDMCPAPPPPPPPPPPEPERG